jgi:hypothetical protein
MTLPVIIPLGCMSDIEFFHEQRVQRVNLQENLHFCLKNTFNFYDTFEDSEYSAFLVDEA